ncbi:hypothetical protein MPSEU_001100000 [Mayamaea pseudoterrestris]|nr:hypothetical protein MPSEU_001100000 [Mayamaea pseudoterrestris]
MSSRRSRLSTILTVAVLLRSTLFGCHASTINNDERASHSHQTDRRLAENRDQQKDSPLFAIHPNIQVVGPTAFPRPTDYFHRRTSSINNKDAINITNFIQPKFGQHRPDQDAVLALAAEYTLDNYLVFVESLRRTGFQGDIVLSLSPIDYANDEIRSYLQSDPHIIVYVPTLHCFNLEGEVVDSVKGGMRICHLPNMYGIANSNNGTVTPLDDPRPARTVSVTRYEIYWIMARHYDSNCWLLLVDSRDTYFQTNPFAHVPRQAMTKEKAITSGLLYFFGENADATRIGASNMNRKWLTLAYGDYVAQTLSQKPIVCSGATMGEAVALDAYLRAMVSESDETNTVIYGADQGFHNFLYYSGKLRNAEAIHAIVVFEQGQGIVNNMGAMRTKDLAEWGNGKILTEIDNVDHPGEAVAQVLNWDGNPSPVVHQYDRHDLLTRHFYKRKREHFRNDYNARQKVKTEVKTL